ncbi:SDR family oxidoreductase [Paractinoplanes globisporus]|uniref:SDR family oxidoreductase n=1 Tax=Paractinoplanes globisporus TaxID=113565 RepID=A0ABW6W5T8_9ACTN|nr:SDR family oxidoreductase [Actinoplanes globisporus]
MSDLIAVTGATGGLGALVIDHLLRRTTADRIVAVARDAGKAAVLPPSIQVRIADHDDRAAVDAALSGIDTLLLVSGNEFGKRMTQHRNVIEAAKAAGVSRIAYTSAPHADTSTAAITAEHKATEQIIRDSGLTYTILRTNSYHENYRSHLVTAPRTGVIIGSVHDGRVASAAKSDYAEAAAVVLTTAGHDNAVHELTGDTAWNYHDLAATISEITGVVVTYLDLSSDEHAAALRAQGLDEPTIAFLVQLDADLAHGVSADATDHLRHLIGRPATPLLDGLRALHGDCG